LNEQKEDSGRAAWLGGVLVLVVVVALAWLAVRSPVTDMPTAAPAGDGSLQARWPMLSASEVAVSMAPLPPVTAPLPPPLAVGECGATEEQSSLPPKVKPTEARQTLERLERLELALLGSSADHARALGRVVQAMPRPVEAVRSGDGLFAPFTLVPTAAASAAAAQASASSAAGRGDQGDIVKPVAAASAPRDALAELARVSRSPDLYAMAWHTCRQGAPADAGSACALLSAEQWAALDPDNGVPWLAVAARAAERGDQAAVSEALFRLSRAKTVDTRRGRLADTALQFLPQGAPPAWSLATLRELDRLEASWTRERHEAPMDYCASARLADANVHQRCNEIAETLLARGASVQDLGAATQLGARLGWPKERVTALQQQHEALSLVVQNLGVRGTDCAALRQQGERLRDVVRLGERAAALAVVQRSGKTEADLAALFRQQRQEIAAAASAPAAGP
jgi:hypothetical protein